MRPWRTRSTSPCNTPPILSINHLMICSHHSLAGTPMNSGMPVKPSMINRECLDTGDQPKETKFSFQVDHHIEARICGGDTHPDSSLVWIVDTTSGPIRTDATNCLD